MSIAVYLAVVASVAACGLTLTRSGRFLADGLAPRVAATLLAGVSALLAATSSAALVFVVVLGAVTMDPDAARWYWSSATAVPTDFGHTVVLVRAVALVALVLVAVAAWRLVRTTTAIAGQYREARAVVPRGARPGSVIEVPGAVVAARAVAVRGGHVLVDDVRWNGLPPAHQAAVLAHERSHLCHRHDRHLAVALLAEALNPALIPMTHAVGYAVERWADEDAALQLGRTAVACAIGAVALSTPERPHFALEATGGVVPRRVAVLLGPGDGCRPRSSGVLAAALLLLAVAATGMGGEALIDLLRVIAVSR